MSKRSSQWRVVVLAISLGLVGLVSRAGPAVSAPSQVPPQDRAGADLQNAFIWLPSAPPGYQAHVAFRKRFQLAQLPKTAVFRLFADSRYMLWVNGRYVERGPCRFDPGAPEYDEIDVSGHLKVGENALTVLVHHCHDGKSGTDWGSINGRIMRHAPGLTAELELAGAEAPSLRLRTDASWRASTHTRFLLSPTDRWENTWSSIPDRIDARQDPGDWTEPAFDDSGWETPLSVPGTLWGPLRARSIPRLREKQVGPLTLVETNGRPCRLSCSNLWPVTLRTADTCIIDVGQFVQAYTVLALDANPGSQLELEYAQDYFDTGRKPSGSYGHVNRYIAKAGPQTYMSGDTFGFKYLVVRVTAGRLRLQDLQVISRTYPFEVAGSFHCNDPLLNTIWSNCVRTVLVCSEDAYVDCATRERTEWMADGFAVAYRTTRVALAGPGENGKPYPADPRLLRNLLRHIAQSAQPDGRLKAHHPSDRWDIHGYIEDYACLWVQALREYVDHTGDLGLVRELWPACTGQMQWFLDRRTTNGLVKAREFVYPNSPLAYKVCEGATLNAFIARALRDAAWLAGQLGKLAQRDQYSRAGQELSRAVNDRLWDATNGTYFSSLTDGRLTPPTAHAALCCLQLDIVPEDRVESTRRWLLQNHLKEDFSLTYTYQFLLAEIYRANSELTDRAVLDLIRQRWAAMARGETGTVWESLAPGENCHEAGAVPAYFLSAYVLGARLEGPASAHRLIIEPHLANLTEAEGVVVTEAGNVSVAWKRNRSGGGVEFSLEVPPGAQATLALPVSSESAAVTLDGTSLPLAAVKRVPGRLLIGLGPGPHTGRVQP
jgi:alpha-L-rhamnosidase